MVHQLNAKGQYAEFMNAEPEWRNPVPRMGLNAEFLNQEWLNAEKKGQNAEIL